MWSLVRDCGFGLESALVRSAYKPDAMCREIGPGLASRMCNFDIVLRRPGDFSVSTGFVNSPESVVAVFATEGGGSAKSSESAQENSFDAISGSLSLTGGRIEQTIPRLCRPYKSYGQRHEDSWSLQIGIIAGTVPCGFDQF